MDDLTVRIRELDLLEVPDLRAQARGRLATSARTEPPEPPRRSGERVAAAIVAVAVFAAAAAFAVRAFRADPIQTTRPADAWAWAGEGWTELPAPPAWRDAPAIVWTGSHLLSWGGRTTDGDVADDGYVFDPSAGTWSEMPPPPRAVGDARGVWTGDEALFFGVDHEASSTVVLAFDPEGGTWRTSSASRYAPAWGGAWAWTGSELVVAGGGDRGGDETTQAWTFDPARDAWRRLPDMPIAVNLAAATWTGSEVVVIGSEIDGRNHASTRTSVAAAYDPNEDRWERLADPPVSAQTADIDQVGPRLVAWEPYSPAAAEFLDGDGRWRSIGTEALEGQECYAEGTVVAGTLVTWSCGNPAVLDPATNAWARVDPPIAPGPRGITYSAGWTYAAGTVAVVAQIETVVSGGDVRLGDADAPRHLWVWRPPSAPSIPPATTPRAAEDLVGTFMAEWAPGWEPYLQTRASQEVIDVVRAGAVGIPSLEGGGVGNWDTHPATAVDEGVFDVPVDLIADHETVASIVFTVAPGTAADGRSGQLVIVGVRASDR